MFIPQAIPFKRYTNNSSIETLNPQISSEFYQKFNFFLSQKYTKLSMDNFRYVFVYLSTLADFSTSTRHILQLPATDNLSWQQQRGICTPPSAQAYNTSITGVDPGIFQRGLRRTILKTKFVLIYIQNIYTQKSDCTET